VFGEIVDGQMKLSGEGAIARQCWLDIPKHFENTELDEYVVMPNHMHGIIIIKDHVGVQYIEPLPGKFQHVIRQSLGSIIRTYKASVTRQCRRAGLVLFHWQRNYYEHIIRGEKDFRKIQEYIHYNPFKWSLDEENLSY
jgi:REP element-mobilizing transposase RayT